MDTATLTPMSGRITVPISVIIPAYNAERFLADAIRSVYSQTVRVAEVFVIADSCIDRTKQIATELRATVVEHQSRNMATGLNLGVRSSTQPWIALLDADDIWKQEKIELQWKIVQRCPTTGLVACDIFTVQGENVTPLSNRALRDRWENIQSIDVGECSHFLEKVPGELLPRFNIQTTTAMLRRDVFSTVGFFDETLIFGQTMEFFARVLSCYPLAFIEEPLVYHRRHEQNHTRNLEGYWPTHISIVNRMLKHPEKYPAGTGEAYRTRLKQDFHLFERALLKTEETRDHLSQPNQP